MKLVFIGHSLTRSYRNLIDDSVAFIVYSRNICDHVIGWGITGDYPLGVRQRIFEWKGRLPFVFKWRQEMMVEYTVNLHYFRDYWVFVCYFFFIHF